MAKEPILTTRGLVKRYGRVTPSITPTSISIRAKFSA